MPFPSMFLYLFLRHDTLAVLELLCSKPGQNKAKEEGQTESGEDEPRGVIKSAERESWKSAASYSASSVACVSGSLGRELEVWWSRRAAWWETKNRHPRQTALSSDRTQTQACNVMDENSCPSHFKGTNGSLITALYRIFWFRFVVNANVEVLVICLMLPWGCQ